MKTLASILLTMALLSGAAEKARPPYDADLARKLGADDRGMKMYALVLLKTGPRKELPKLVFAGPLEKNDRFRGIFIFNVKTQAEAEALVATDPAVVAGALAGEAYMLYGSAALQEVTGIHHRISRK